METLVDATERESGPFREEAMRHAAEQRQRPGDVLRISPRWTNWVLWLLLLLVAVGLLYTFFGSISEYAEGPAVIVAQRVPVSANASGIIKEVKVQPGVGVNAGRQLASFYDPQAPQVLQFVRAPVGGVVSEVLTQVGRHFQPGETLMTLTKGGDEGSLSVVAVLPGRYRPLLREDQDQELRLKISGYRSAEQKLKVVRVESEAISVSAVRQFLGPELADSLPIQGPAVLVRAELTDERFRAAGEWLDYHHGMHGTASVRVRSQRIISVLLKGLFGKADE